MAKNNQTAAVDTAALLARIAELEQANAALAKAPRQTGAITFKVSEKGAISAYGMGRWPVTLYRGQWEKLMSDDVRTALTAFIEANADKLSTKDANGATVAPPAAPAPAPAADTMAPRLVTGKS